MVEAFCLAHKKVNEESHNNVIFSHFFQPQVENNPNLTHHYPVVPKIFRLLANYKDHDRNVIILNNSLSILFFFPKDRTNRTAEALKKT